MFSKTSSVICFGTDLEHWQPNTILPLLCDRHGQPALHCHSNPSQIIHSSYIVNHKSDILNNCNLCLNQ